MADKAEPMNSGQALAFQATCKKKETLLSMKHPEEELENWSIKEEKCLLRHYRAQFQMRPGGNPTFIEFQPVA